VEELVGKVNKQLGQQAFGSLQKKYSERKIRLVQGLKELKGDLTGSSNSKSLSAGEITRTDQRHCNYYSYPLQHHPIIATTRLDPPIPRCSNAV
jgi:hypothetical protein